MLKLYIMASNGYFPTLVFRQEHGLNRVSKDSQRLLPNYDIRDDVIRSSPLNMKRRNGLFDNNEFVMIEPIVTKPTFIDLQDSCPNSPLSSFNIPEQSTRHKRILNFLMSGLKEAEKDNLDLLPSLSDLTGLKTDDYFNNPSYFFDVGPTMDLRGLIYPDDLVFDSRKPLVEFVDDLVRNSEVNKREMKDMLAILAEFYLLKNSSKWRKMSTLVPQFNRLDYNETSYFGSPLELENVIVAPPKSPQKIKLKPPKKKNNRNKTTIKHRSTSIQAIETLLSIIFDKTRTGKSTILPVLKKSTPELPNLLTQISATIAGTGIAVLFSVVCKLASTSGFCGWSKMVNAGIGIGLVWVSWGVNRLHDTIVTINKNSSKRGLKDEEDLMKDLDRCVKEIYFRGVAVMAVMVLRLA